MILFLNDKYAWKEKVGLYTMLLRVALSEG